jgi:hypothetical protein
MTLTTRQQWKQRTLLGFITRQWLVKIKLEDPVVVMVNSNSESVIVITCSYDL